jgi:hypothetical protein
VTEHLEVLGSVLALGLRVVEGMSERDTLERRLGDPANGLRRIEPERIEHRRDHVDGVRVLAADLAARADPRRPRDHERIGGPAPVRLALPAAERAVAGPGPAVGIVVVGVGPTELVDLRQVVLEALRDHVEEEHLVERTRRTALGRGAVVGDDHDQRVVELAETARGATCRGRTCCSRSRAASRAASRSRTACARHSLDSRWRIP